ncbi:hypothetical protein LCGC14_0663890 [marine sediment metagenome]|uniref:Uncharacterized protein n=1 Tax=marine sediment metagenome TaxID=412755 RepID=A0A0F9QSV2_9ZZZZ
MSKKPHVKLTNRDDNAFSILARVRKALRENGMSDKIDEFTKEATSGDYNHLLQVVMEYCDIE